MSKLKRRSSHKTGINRHAKLRCMCCERVGQPMNKEHLWPRWLIEHTRSANRPIRWIGSKRVLPKAATIPLCKECNNDLGTHLEAPVMQAFKEAEDGRGLSDTQIELLVRWLWKFEGFFWLANYGDHPKLQYSGFWTMKERILGGSIASIRQDLVFGASLIEGNDEGFEDWPFGIDSAIGKRNAIFVAGVFSRIALVVGLTRHIDLIPSSFTTYLLKAAPDLTGAKVLFPRAGFKTPREAIETTRRASVLLLFAHEQTFAHEEEVNVRRPRVELP